jgi:hypothetical protein
MKGLDFNRHALSICAAVALLAGCGGSQPPIGASGAMPQTFASAMHAERGESWMLSGATSQDLLYVSAGGYSGQQGAVLVLSFPKGDLVGTLTGFSVPSGECVDESGDVFVADGGADTIREYAHGGTTPIATLNDPGEPYGCSVDPTTGNLAVTNGSDSVAIYPSAQGTPTLYSDPSIYEYLFCAYDNHGNLFVDGTTSDLIGELPKGGASFTNITFNGAIAGPSSMQWVGGKLVIVDDGAPWRTPTPVDRVQISGSTGIVVGTTHLKSQYGGVAAYVQYWIQGHNIVGPERSNGDGHRFLGFWGYPTGGKPIQTLRHFDSGYLWAAVVSK